ncbi:hypothetical protein A9G28_04965 [Gilliamella sp. Fer1-1]|nr:hypothetical protein [Gilliamella apicola]OCG42879.1 hypothetical protein A9G28_04965 [Gilliamella apicola]
MFEPLINQWHKVGLLQNTDHCLLLTLSGRFWSSNILQALQQLLLQLNNPEYIELQQKMAQEKRTTGSQQMMPHSAIKQAKDPH